MLVRANNYHQRGETIMAQGVLPFQYQDQKQSAGLTALAGLPAYLDLAQAAGLRDAICRHLMHSQIRFTPPCSEIHPGVCCRSEIYKRML